VVVLAAAHPHATARHHESARNPTDLALLRGGARHLGPRVADVLAERPNASDHMSAREPEIKKELDRSCGSDVVACSRCPLCGAAEVRKPEMDEWMIAYKCGSLGSKMAGDEGRAISDGENCRLRCELKDAWGVINTLHMEAMDHREAWPRALGWLHRNAEFRPENVLAHPRGEEEA
jgi:hypothetical protein